MSPEIRRFVLAAAIVAVSILVSQVLRLAFRLAEERLASRTRTTLDDVILGAASLPLRLLVVAFAADYAARQLIGLPASWNRPADHVFFTIYAFLVYLLLLRLVGGVSRWYAREVAHLTETEFDDNFLNLFRHVTIITLSAIVAIIVLSRFGVEVSALVTTLGISSLAVALAGQETLGNMIAGFTIMVDRPFTVGDRIELLEIGTWGDVVEIGIRSTRIMTRDARQVTVPNSVIVKGLVVNYSYPSTMFRVQTHVGIAYGTDVEFARRVMIEAVMAEPWVMKDQRIEALFLEFGDSALVFRVRCWIEHYMETRRAVDRLNTALYHALNREGIAIPFPQRDLHLVSGLEAIREDPGPS